jgi:hypothetical protein
VWIDSRKERQNLSWVRMHEAMYSDYMSSHLFALELVESMSGQHYEVCTA